MVRVADDCFNVVGDSIEACLYSRHLVETNPKIKQINHYTTGEYGGFYFDGKIDDSFVAYFLTENNVNRICEYIGLNLTRLATSSIKIPAKKIKFTTVYDDHIDYPINRGSFELDMDYKDAVKLELSFDEYVKEYKQCKNITKLMKSIFSEQFYMNVIKKIGCNQWDMNQSQFDPCRLYNILQLSQISSEVPAPVYYPTNGASEMCKELLNHPKINVIVKKRSDIKNTIKLATSLVTYVFEYIDYYFDFIFGGLDYMKASTKIHSKNIAERNYFRTITPHDLEYYMYFGIGQLTYKTKNVPTRIRSNDFSRLALVPSASNFRKIAEYHKVANVNRNLKIMI